MTTEKQAIAELAVVLRSYGEMFTGGHAPEKIAEEWYEEGIADADECGAWCAVYVWNPSVAGALSNAGITPQRLAEIEATMIESVNEPYDTWTDGSPVYAICNDDLSVYDIIDAEEKMA